MALAAAVWQSAWIMERIVVHDERDATMLRVAVPVEPQSLSHVEIIREALTSFNVAHIAQKRVAGYSASYKRHSL
jgi:hypothetical protein